MAKMERASFVLIQKKYAARKMGNVRLTQSSLVFKQAIEASKNTYDFAVLTTDGQPQKGEVRLNINDEFINYEQGYFLEFTTPKTSDPNKTNSLLLPYVPLEINGRGLSDLAPMHDATLKITVNGIDRLNNWDMLRHKCVPRTQFQNTSAGIPSATIPSVCYADSGFTTMQPMITFSGAKKNEIQIALQESLSLGNTFDFLSIGGAMTFTSKNLVLMYRGMLAQNAAKFQ